MAGDLRKDWKAIKAYVAKSGVTVGGNLDLGPTLDKLQSSGKEADAVKALKALETYTKEIDKAYRASKTDELKAAITASKQLRDDIPKYVKK